MHEHATASNASSVNYLDQYRMQQILPGAPAGSAASRPDPFRQSIESSINKTMEVVRVALITQCRDYSEGLLYEVKQLKEELRSRGEECQNAVETVNRLREQIERDRAIIREHVPPERLMQLGHPYSSLVTMPPASAIPAITESATQAPPAPQALLSSIPPSQPPPQSAAAQQQQQQQPPQAPQPQQQQHPPSQPQTQHQSE